MSVPPVCTYQQIMVQSIGHAPSSSPSGDEQTGSVPLGMSYQQRLVQTLRIGFKHLRERNMIDISSNGLVEFKLFLDALSRIEDRVTPAIEVYDAAGADTHLKIIVIDNSRYIT